jgi:hypothetical protein
MKKLNELKNQKIIEIFEVENGKKVHVLDGRKI